MRKITAKREWSNMVYLVDFENVTSAGISGIQRLTKEDKVYIFYTVNAANMSFAAQLNLLSSPAEVIYYNVSSGGKNALDFQLSSFLGYLISKGEEKSFCIISNDKGFEYVKSFWERSGLAAGISIDAAPSINRALLPMEKPFTAKIQQGIKPGQDKSIEAEDYSAAEDTPPVQTIQPVQDAQNTHDPEEVMEKKTKKRGRPKKKKSEVNAALEQVKALLAKADVTDLDKIVEVAELLKKSTGKQHFYRNMLTIFGMEKGVVVYKAIRPEYTNLTKLAKQ